MCGSLAERPSTCAGRGRPLGVCALLGLLLLGAVLPGCKGSAPSGTPAPSKERSAQPDWATLFAEDPEAFKEFQQVQGHLRTSNYLAATDGLRKLLARSPEAPWAEALEFMLVQAWRMVPDYGQALKQADSFLARHSASPDAPRVLLYKGEVFLELGKEPVATGAPEGSSQSYLDRAEQIFLSLLGSYPDDRVLHAQVWYMLGATFSATGDTGKAKAAYRKVADEYTDTAYPSKALYRLAGVLLSEGNPEGAGDAFREITGRFPESREALKAREKLEGIALVGTRAPAFAVKEWVGGPPRSVEALRGQVLLLDFWAIWCPYCRSNLPRMDRLLARYGSLGLAVVGISRERSDYDADKIRQFIESHPMAFPTAVDEESKTSKAFAVTNIPCVVAVDRQGWIRWHGHPEHLTDQVIEGLLGPSS